MTYNEPFTLTLKAGWNLVAAAPGTTLPGRALWLERYDLPERHRARGVEGILVQGGLPEQNVRYRPSSVPIPSTLRDGWNLIGNCMATAATLTLPSGALALVYDPDTGYVSPKTTLQPGQGAWVKATAGQQVTLTASGG